MYKYVNTGNIKSLAINVKYKLQTGTQVNINELFRFVWLGLYIKAVRAAGAFYLIFSVFSRQRQKKSGEFDDHLREQKQFSKVDHGLTPSQ